LSDRHYDLLPIELADLKETNYDLRLLGFDAEEPVKLLDPRVKDGLRDPDVVSEPPHEAVTKPGDLEMLSDHSDRNSAGDKSAWNGTASLYASSTTMVAGTATVLVVANLDEHWLL
jgi:hypothetical protein